MQSTALSAVSKINKEFLDNIPTGWYVPTEAKMTLSSSTTNAKTRIIDAAVHAIRAKGYSATTVDDLCRAAEVTKGGFFHHFDSKEQLAITAAQHFASTADHVFSTAPYRSLPDPLDRLLGYVDFRKAILQGDLPQFTCLLGTMVQETYDTHPAIREACNRCMQSHVEILESDIAEAMQLHGIGGSSTLTARSLALYTQAVLQGAFVLAKAEHGPAVAAACLDHLRLYLVMLFVNPARPS
jgi:TetR/AcrR family transcriptional repressor of nem operon